MEVAQMIEKDHAKLLRDIHRYINQIEKINETKIGQSKIGFTDFFIESTYTTSQNKTQPCYNITHKGCEFIANKLTGIKGTEFTARYVTRFHELEEGNSVNELISTMKSISDTMLEIQKSTNERLNKLEDLLKKDTAQANLPEKKYSRWKTNTFTKLRTLLDYVNAHTDQNLMLADVMRITINEMQDTYDIELSDYVRSYMFENGLRAKPYDLDVINNYKELRTLYTSTVDAIMARLNLQPVIIQKNIFDELAAKM